MSSTTDRTAGRAEIAARTLRTDLWWRPPLIQATVLTVLLGYVVVRLFLRQDYWVPEYNYLTPFYSPCISASVPGSTHFGSIFGELPIGSRCLHGVAVPARLPRHLLLLPQGLVPLVLVAPAACAVAEPHDGGTPARRGCR